MGHSRRSLPAPAHLGGRNAADNDQKLAAPRLVATGQQRKPPKLCEAAFDRESDVAKPSPTSEANARQRVPPVCRLLRLFPGDGGIFAFV
jgi:hypothetical protein